MAQIHSSDDVHLAELFRDAANGPVDLMLETNGGYTDATEKLVAIIRRYTDDLRVIVPRRAKSNGTLVALAARAIVMGPVSELGPIDPFINLGPQQSIPAQFILATQNVDPILFQSATHAVAQTMKLAQSLLETGMMAGRPQADIGATIDKLATRNHFHSHGSVIDADEAAAIGFTVERLKETDELWRRLWLLRCLYSDDLRSASLVKIFEGRQISNSLKASPI